MTGDQALALCAGAADLIRRSPASLAHRRGAAIVARQAIEGIVRAALGEASATRLGWRSRFLLLVYHAGEDQAAQRHARRGHHLWSAWSEVCHYRPYDLVPAAPVLLLRLEETRQWIAGTADVSSTSWGRERSKECSR